MNIWKFYGVTHRDHLVMNPTSEEKTDEFIGLLPLKSGARVLDIASGKGEQLLRIIKRHDATGVGIDISPYEVKKARRRADDRQLSDRVEFIEGDGAKYDAEPNSFDLTMCLGASWVWGGHLGTIEALKKIVKPSGLTLLYAIVSAHNDWDRYEGLRIRAAELYAEENPEDPDAAEILEKQRQSSDLYLKYGRDTVGWAIYMFRAPQETPGHDRGVE